MLSDHEPETITALQNGREVEAYTDEHGFVRDKRHNRFVTGGKPGPGRPKGSKNALAEDFVRDLHAHWLENGAEAMDRTLKERPDQYLRTIAIILPREIKHTLDDLSDGALSERIGQLAEALGLELKPTIDVTPDTKKAENSQS